MLLECGDAGQAKKEAGLFLIENIDDRKDRMERTS